MNVREFAEMLLKLPDQEAIVQVVDGDGFNNFSEDEHDCHIAHVNFTKSTGVAATSSWYQKNYLQIGYSSD